MSRGGARPGAGRPKKAEKYAPQITALEDRIADRLPQLLARALKLADGGFEQVEQVFAPAGTITIGSGDNLTLVFPDKKPDELVLIKRSVTRAAPDRAMLQYLIDRIAGKPTQRVEADVDSDGTLTVRVVYADPAGPDDDAGDNLDPAPAAPGAAPDSPGGEAL